MLDFFPSELFICFPFKSLVSVNPIWPGLFLGVPGPGDRGRKVPAAPNSKTIHGIEMKFGRVVENHKLTNWQL